MSDLRSCSSGYVTNSRIPGVDFDAVYYADDTILFSIPPRGLNELLQHMEECSGHYGLKLNRAKCHSMNRHRDSNIHFGDGTVLDKTQGEQPKSNGEPQPRNHPTNSGGNDNLETPCSVLESFQCQ